MKSRSFEDAARLSVAACGVMCQWTDRLRNEIRCSGCWWMCLARFGSPATACVDQAEDLSPQSSPFRDAWIGKDVRNKRVSDRVLFPSPAPFSFPSKVVGNLTLVSRGLCDPLRADRIPSGLAGAHANALIARWSIPIARSILFPKQGRGESHPRFTWVVRSAEGGSHPFGTRWRSLVTQPIYCVVVR